MSQQVNALDITPDKLRVAAAGKLQIVLLSPELCYVFLIISANFFIIRLSTYSYVWHLLWQSQPSYELWGSFKKCHWSRIPRRWSMDVHWWRRLYCSSLGFEVLIIPNKCLQQIMVILTWLFSDRGHNLQCQRIFQVSAPVNCVCLHPNQGELIVGDQSGVIHLWDLKTDHNEQLVSTQFPSSPGNIFMNFSSMLMCSSDSRSRSINPKHSYWSSRYLYGCC